MINNWSDIKYFKQGEFDSPDIPGSGVRMNLNTVGKLDALREACGFPLTIVSGYRSPQHNAEVNGKSASAHMSGHAADIAILTSQMRFTILRQAFGLGFTRVGVADTFIHLDDDETLPQYVTWTY